MALQGVILGMGNPLLDISATVDQAFLDKYGLQMDNQILAEDKHTPMYAEMEEKFNVEYIPGGATQNTVRVAQWMLGVPKACAYMGSVGDDERSKKMKEIMDAQGCVASYFIDPEAPTGTCAVCVKDGERSLVANLAAANNYKADHLKQPENWALLESARIVYSAGFFITVSPESITAAAKHCCEAGKMYCMNISAPFICEVPPFKKVLSDTMPYVDFLFGNENEFAAFAKSEGWDEKDLAGCALKIAGMPKASGHRPRVVVVTQGAQPTLVARGGRVASYLVDPIDKAKIVDTNGAGDAFVGGFLSQLALGKDDAECCRAGNYAAGQVIQVSGCKMPGKCEFVFA
ncbi:unnamed protein product [Pedinophyceae sp. YPF-701]|nr:unnamed protein product [Pedinophyceae sp. YPF-701]